MTAVLIPAGLDDPWRARAHAYVCAWYAHNFPELELVTGSCSGDWSKGEAVDDARRRAGPHDVYVIADADSFLLDPAHLADAVALVDAGHPYAIPHRDVYRLRDTETERLHADPTARPRLGWTCRPKYEGPPGGGITVISAETYDLVDGIDPRFRGWGGEDLAFGWALHTLAGPGERLDGRLVHLWHPHPAPNLRGSPESEELVAQYRTARGVPRRMSAVTAGQRWEPLPPLPEPLRFRIMGNRRSLRLPSGELVRFAHGVYVTADVDEIEQLRTFRIVREEPLP